MKQSSRYLHIAAVLFTLSLATLSAEAACFRSPTGVPGFSNQPPDWWSPSAAKVVSTLPWTEDPRWAGASAFGETQDGVQFRGLMETVGADRFLVLMWNVRSDVSGPVGDDKLFVGLQDAGGTMMYRFIVNSALPTEGQDFPATNVSAYSFDGTSWSAAASPSWLTDKNTQLDVFSTGAGGDWAVRARIPVSPTAGGFHFTYQLQTGNVATDTQYSFPNTATYFSVTTAAEGCALPSGLCAQLPLPAAWESFDGTTTCTGDVSIVRDNIYVGMPGNTVIDLNDPNPIKARPKNNTSIARDNDSIRAKFRLANWGSVIGVSATWNTLDCAEPQDAEGYLTGPSGTVAASGSGTPMADQFDITCTWTVTDPANYPPACTTGCKHVDQCVLVDLAQTEGLGAVYTFAPQSAWRNLMFIGASKITKSALIDVRGIAVGDPARDVYLYVKTQHMPERITEKTPVPAQNIGKNLLEKLRKYQVQIPDGRSIGKEAAQGIQRAMAEGILTEDEVRSFMPSYSVYVWHDTGEKHEGRPIVKAQPSFTYMVHHDGPLEGWKHSIEASGFTMSEVLPNYYKLSVPAGGQATVTSTIESLEEPPCPDGSAPPCVKPCPDGKTMPPCPPSQEACPDGSAPPCKKPGLPWWLVVLIGLIAVVLLGLLARHLSKKK